MTMSAKQDDNLKPGKSSTTVPNIDNTLLTCALDRCESLARWDAVTLRPWLWAVRSFANVAASHGETAKAANALRELARIRLANGMDSE